MTDRVIQFVNTTCSDRHADANQWDVKANAAHARARFSRQFHDATVAAAVHDPSRTVRIRDLESCPHHSRLEEFGQSEAQG